MWGIFHESMFHNPHYHQLIDFNELDIKINDDEDYHNNTIFTFKNCINFIILFYSITGHFIND